MVNRRRHRRDGRLRPLQPPPPPQQLPRLCGACSKEGHNRNAARCELHGLGNGVMALTYHIVMRIRSGPDQNKRIAVPYAQHHAVVLSASDEPRNIREFGFGPKGITINAPGKFHGRRGEQMSEYVPTDLIVNATGWQMDQVVTDMRGEWTAASYCALHHNCVSFCQEFLRRLYALDGRELADMDMPRPFRQYRQPVINQLLQAVRFVAGQLGHPEAVHPCVAF